MSRDSVGAVSKSGRSMASRSKTNRVRAAARPRRHVTRPPSGETEGLSFYVDDFELALLPILPIESTRLTLNGACLG